jgi:hypothetical protein
MKQICGCCTGVEAAAPQAEANRPGLSALSYRVGAYATFFETMIARLSNLYLDVPVAPGQTATNRIYPLQRLTTRELTDPSIALLDAWSIVAAVLTFYQERIANEGYLATASERRSVLELGRLVGYRLRPGVSASVYLAFTAATGFNGTIPAGTRAQSVPQTNTDSAQFFETSLDLPARDEWNTLLPRLARPQVITLKVDPGTDAATRDTIYFNGISTSLKTGDALLIVLGNGFGQQVFRLIESVDVQTDQNRTEVTLQDPPLDTSGKPSVAAHTALDPFVAQAAGIFANSDLAVAVAEILTTLLANVDSSTDTIDASNMIVGAIPQVQEQNEIAQKRRFTRLEPWTSEILRVLNNLALAIANSDGNTVLGVGSPLPVKTRLAPSPLEKLTAILEPLALPPSLQPANSKQLVRTLAQTFSVQADIAPRMLGIFRPLIAPTLYKAWAGVDTPLAQPLVYAMRVKASPYGSTAPRQFTVKTDVVPAPSEWPLDKADVGTVLSFDSVYDKITPGSWVVVNSPDITTGPRITQVASVQTVARAEYGIAAKVTQADIQIEWLPTAGVVASQSVIDTLRRVTVWAQPELLDLADEPLDTDIEGSTIELARLYDGFESGRWIVVSGERTDIPDTTGVTGSELVMIAGVSQGSNAPNPAQFPAGYIPFSRIFYTSDANTKGDRLVVGELVGDVKGLAQLSSLPIPKIPDQQFVSQVQLAPGFYVNAYVPTADELAGKFPDFQGLLVHPPDPTSPSANLPYPGGIIPATDLGATFAWRITAGKVHTVLTLANSLAYKYDSTSVNIYGNVVNATNGQTVGEILGDGDASRPFQRFALGQQPLTYLSAATPDGTASTLTVRVNEIAWDEAPNFTTIGPSDRAYITSEDDASLTTVIFGNGTNGTRVPTGPSNIKATYRYGLGAGGNVNATLIGQLSTHPQGVQGVINPLGASGGADADSIDDARRNTPVALQALDRLVSTVDYANFSRTFAGIGKASAARLTDGRRQFVHVTIAGAGDIPINLNSDLYRNLVKALGQFGDPYLPISVVVRKLKLLVIIAGVKILPAYLWESVSDNVTAALLDSFSFANRDLGQSAFMSEAIGIMQSIEGVSYVNVTVFDAVSEDVTAAQLAGLASSLAPRNFVEADLAHNDPLLGTLPAELAILTPAIPDTIILTEIKS